MFHFAGTLTNPTAGGISINGDTFNFSTLSPDFTLDDTPFTASTLGAKGSGSDIYKGGFFDVLVASSAQPGTYYGTFLILGGADLNAQDTVGSGDFSVTVQGAPAVPEASTTASFGLLLALGVGSAVVSARRRKVAATL